LVSAPIGLCQEDVSISRFLFVRSFRRRYLPGGHMLADATDIAGGAALGRLIASYHLSKQVHIVITFARHLFADRLQLLKKPGAFIHKLVVGDWWLVVGG